jgi:hypothetical protein
MFRPQPSLREEILLELGFRMPRSVLVAGRQELLRPLKVLMEQSGLPLLDLLTLLVITDQE